MGESTIAPGTQLGGYRVEGVLGRGGFGLVYEAYHQRLRRRAAVKVLHGVDPDGLRRFEREAQAVARLRHPAILSVFDFGELEGQAYMVSEYMPGGSLDRRLTGAPLPPAEALALLGPIAEALDYAHSEGIVHRDVKPANIFLDAAGRPVLADFGLSKLLGGDASRSSLVAGSPSYIAPEQAMGKEPSGATDQYALAVAAYELLTGRLPFAADNPMAVLYKHINEEAPRADSINPALPPAVQGVLARGMAKDPAARFPACAAFVDALQGALEGQAPETVTATRQLTVAASAARTKRAAASRGRRKLLLGLAALVVLGAAALLAHRLLGPSPAPGLSLAADSLPVGGTLEASGSGFAGAPAVNLELDDLTVARTSPGNDGSVHFKAVLDPSVAAGDHEVKACAQGGACSAALGLTVTAAAGGDQAAAQLRVEPAPLVLNTRITVSGSGLEPALDARIGLLQGTSTEVIPLHSDPFRAGADGSFSQDNLVVDPTQGIKAGVPTLLVACNLIQSGEIDLSRCLQLKVEVVGS